MYQYPGNDYQPQHPHLFLYSAGNAKHISKDRLKKVQKLMKRMVINPMFKKSDAIWKNSGYECVTVVKGLKLVGFDKKKKNNKDWEMRFDKYFIMQFFTMMPHEPFYKYYDYGTGAVTGGPIKFYRYNKQFETMSKAAADETDSWKAGKLPITRHKTKRGFYLEIAMKNNKPPPKKCLKKKG